VRCFYTHLGTHTLGHTHTWAHRHIGVPIYSSRSCAIKDVKVHMCMAHHNEKKAVRRGMLRKGMRRFAKRESRLKSCPVAVHSMGGHSNSGRRRGTCGQAGRSVFQAVIQPGFISSLFFRKGIFPREKERQTREGNDNFWVVIRFSALKERK